MFKKNSRNSYVDKNYNGRLKFVHKRVHITFSDTQKINIIHNL